MTISRRNFIQMGTASLLISLSHSCTQNPRTQSNPTPSEQLESPQKIAIGYWPIAAGLPLYLALEKGYFQEVGLDVEAVRFPEAQQVAEALVYGRIQGCANGTGSGNLALSEIASPGLFKIIAGNPSNTENVLEEIIVAKNSPIQTVEELKGKQVACVSSIHSIILVEGILEKVGVKNPKIVQIPIEQHISAVMSGKVDAAYTFEPIGTMGKLAGTTRVLQGGVVAKYILGDSLAPWFGGSAVLRTSFLKSEPDLAKKYIAAYRRAIVSIRNHPNEARQYLSGYTSIKGELAQSVPLPAFTMYDEFTNSDIQYFEKYLELFYQKGVLTRKVDVASLIFKDSTA